MDNDVLPYEERVEVYVSVGGEDDVGRDDSHQIDRKQRGGGAQEQHRCEVLSQSLPGAARDQRKSRFVRRVRTGCLRGALARRPGT